MMVEVGVQSPGSSWFEGVDSVGGGDWKLFHQTPTTVGNAAEKQSLGRLDAV